MSVNNYLSVGVLTLVVGGLASWCAYNFFRVDGIIASDSATPEQAISIPTTTDTVRNDKNPMSDTNIKIPVKQEIDTPRPVEHTPSSTDTSSGIVTDIFAGRVAQKISETPIDGQAAAQYEFEIVPHTLTETKGSASGVVILSVSSEISPGYGNFSGPSGNALWRVHAHYNVSLGWYEVVGLAITIVDEYAADFSEDRILAGASHNIFVGRVVRQVGSKALGSAPETQYLVEVVENVKGDLKEQVLVNQIGGYKNGVLYLTEGTYSLLKPGSTYVFATRYNRDEDWHTLNPHPRASKLLSSDAHASAAQLHALSASDSRFIQLQQAYSNEVLLEADVLNGNTLNSYIKYSAESNESHF